MNIKDIAEPSGLIFGINHHDQTLVGFATCAGKCTLEIATDEGDEICLEFSGLFSSSIRKFLRKTIILSMFLWETARVPDWFLKDALYSECLEDGPITSKYVFFMDSSYGASVCVLFDSMRVTVNGVHIIFEI